MPHTEQSARDGGTLSGSGLRVLIDILALRPSGMSFRPNDVTAGEGLVNFWQQDYVIPCQSVRIPLTGQLTEV